MTQRWSLLLSLVGPYGERIAYAIDLDESIAQEVVRVSPPDPTPFIGDSFSRAVEILRRKEFRKDLFTQESARLGALLAERMEDSEGWHGVERIENAKRALKGTRL